MALFGRFLRLIIFLLGIALGVVAALFAVGNQESIKVTIWTYDYHVQVYALVLVPLAIGLAAGWLYTLPARGQEFTDHWRSWRTVRRMEKENKQLRRNLDQVLELPDEAEAERHQSSAPLALDARPVAGSGNGHSEPAGAAGAAGLPAELADLEPLAAPRSNRTRPAHPAESHKEPRHREKAAPEHAEAEKPHAEKAPAEHGGGRRAGHEAKPAGRTD